MEEKLIYRTVAITERLPKVANENYLTISKNGIETARFFNGTRFETAHYEGDIFFWLEKIELPSEEKIYKMGDKHKDEHSVGDNVKRVMYHSYVQGAEDILKLLSEK